MDLAIEIFSWMASKLSQILGKIRKIIKLRKMLFIKLESDYFSENYLLVFSQSFGKFENQRKPWENDFRLILLKKFIFSENCR